MSWRAEDVEKFEVADPIKYATVIRVVDTVRYRYAAPVVRDNFQLRVIPRSVHGQNLVMSRVDSTPVAHCYLYTDYWGNTVTSIYLHAPHTELTIVSSAVVETGDSAPPASGATWADLRSPMVNRYSEYLKWTRRVPRNTELADIARSLRAGRSPAEAVRAVSEWVYDKMTYQRGTTGMDSSAVWAARAGVCVDYAHLSLALLRAIGIPSRFVSGYCLDLDPNVRVGETLPGGAHAWIEAWTGGWWGFDPTHNEEIGPGHIWVAMARDGGDVPLLKGTHAGGTTEALEESLDITRLA